MFVLYGTQGSGAAAVEAALEIAGAPFRVVAAARDPESWLRVYPKEFELPEDQKKAWIADRTGAIVGADTAKKYGWKVGQRVPIQHIRDGVADIEHQHPQPAVILIRACTPLISCLAHTGDRCQRAVDQPDLRL